MGILRVLLATAVVLQHVGSLHGWTMTGTVVSVQTFYIVSGFYMALILSEKYVGRGSYSLFITNRFLKIFPIYWGILLLTLGVSAAFYATRQTAWFAQPLLDSLDSLSTGARGFLIVANIIVFGQDAVMFLAAGPSGELTFTSNFRETSPQLFNMLLVPQAWTLALELMFYLIAPLLVRQNTGKLIALAALSLMLRVFNYRMLGWNDDPWTYRFFPTEILFFVAGMLSYRLYLGVRHRVTPALAWSGWLVVIMLTTTFQFFPGGSVKWAAYYGLVTLCLPLIFVASRNLRSDRLLGEMSYPVYLSHLFVFGLATSLFAVSDEATRWLTIVCTFGLSYLLVRYLAKPLDDFRQARVRAKARSV